jgi:UbiD family decarboxylase
VSASTNCRGASETRTKTHVPPNFIVCVESYLLMCLCNQPFETLKTELHGLPMPAHAEIVLEAEILLDHLRSEGTLRRMDGLLYQSVREDHVVRVRRVYYRNVPIMTMACPICPPSDYSLSDA